MGPWIDLSRKLQYKRLGRSASDFRDHLYRELQSPDLKMVWEAREFEREARCVVETQLSEGTTQKKLVENTDQIGRITSNFTTAIVFGSVRPGLTYR